MAAKRMLVSNPDGVIPTPRSDKGERDEERKRPSKKQGTFEVAVNGNWKGELQVYSNLLK